MKALLVLSGAGIIATSLLNLGSPFKIHFFFCLCWVFVALHGLSLAAVSRGYFVVVCRLLTVVLSLVVEHKALGAQASVVVAHSLS